MHPGRNPSPEQRAPAGARGRLIFDEDGAVTRAVTCCGIMCEGNEPSRCLSLSPSFFPVVVSMVEVRRVDTGYKAPVRAQTLGRGRAPQRLPNHKSLAWLRGKADWTKARRQSRLWIRHRALVLQRWQAGRRDEKPPIQPRRNPGTFLIHPGQGLHRHQASQWKTEWRRLFFFSILSFVRTEQLRSSPVRFYLLPACPRRMVSAWCFAAFIPGQLAAAVPRFESGTGPWT